MDLFDKLRILADSAKYDAACTSSGVDRSSSEGGGFRIGNAASCGLCHSFAADGRCISLLTDFQKFSTCFNGKREKRPFCYFDIKSD